MRTAPNSSRQAPRRPAFHRFAKKASLFAGRPAAFLLAVSVIVGWLATGPVFHWSDTWQLFVNTGTTIVTFLMVFLIQNTQDRESEAVQLKLDELLRAQRGAHNTLLDAEELELEELEELRDRYKRLAEDARAQRRSGRDDTGCPPA